MYRKRTALTAVPISMVTSKPSWMRVRTAASRRRKQSNTPSLSEFTPDKYLLSHCSIVCGVSTLKDIPWVIESRHSILVNDNGNAWTNSVLLKTYKTFVGAQNYVEHIQEPELSRGRILDAVARWVTHEIKLGPTLYVDILVATDRSHTELVEAIETNKVNKMSMGCSVTHTQCSECGKIFEDDDEDCEHLSDNKKGYFELNGQRHRVAELCGHVDHEGSNVFTEASWVFDPAFGGAERRSGIGQGIHSGTPLEKIHSSLEARKASFRRMVANVLSKK